MAPRLTTSLPFYDNINPMSILDIRPEDDNEGDRLASLEGLAANIRVELLERRLETLEGKNLAFISTTLQAVSGQHSKQAIKEKKALTRKRRITPPDLRTGGSSSSPHDVVGDSNSLDVAIASCFYVNVPTFTY